MRQVIFIKKKIEKGDTMVLIKKSILTSLCFIKNYQYSILDVLIDSVKYFVRSSLGTFSLT